MGVQVVHDQKDVVTIGIADSTKKFNFLCPINSRTVFMDVYMVYTGVSSSIRAFSSSSWSVLLVCLSGAAPQALELGTPQYVRLLYAMQHWN